MKLYQKVILHNNIVFFIFGCYIPIILSCPTLSSGIGIKIRISEISDIGNRSNIGCLILGKSIIFYGWRALRWADIMPDEKSTWVIKNSCTGWGSRKWHHELRLSQDLPLFLLRLSAKNLTSLPVKKNEGPQKIQTSCMTIHYIHDEYVKNTTIYCCWVGFCIFR